MPEFNIGFIIDENGIFVPVIEIKTSAGQTMLFTCDQGVPDRAAIDGILKYIRRAVMTYAPDIDKSDSNVN